MASKPAEMDIHVRRSLFMALLKIQYIKDLDFDDACKWAATLIDSKEKSYWKDVQTEADRILRSKYLTDLNKARSTIEKKAYDEGYQKGYGEAYNIGYGKAMEIQRFRTPCAWCGKPMEFTSEQSNWAEVKQTLDKVFSNFTHVGICAQKRLERVNRLLAQKRAAQESYSQED